jgi:hypothetical protein
LRKSANEKDHFLTIIGFEDASLTQRLMQKAKVADIK